MRSSSIFLIAAAALAPFVAGTELKIDPKDVPSACTQTCAQIQQLTQTCYNNRDKNNSDKSEAACVCPNKTFDVSSAAVACQQCFTQNKASNDQRENIDRVVKTCSFSAKPSVPQVPTAPVLPLTPSMASCKPLTVTVTMSGNCTGPARTTLLPPARPTTPASVRPPTTPTPVRPPTTPTPIRPSGPSGTRPAGNATRPATPLPTAAAASLNPGFQLAAVAALVYLLA